MKILANSIDTAVLAFVISAIIFAIIFVMNFVVMAHPWVLTVIKVGAVAIVGALITKLVRRIAKRRV